MKVHKRLVSALPRPLALAAPPQQPTARARSNSACSARSFYTAPSTPLSFPFFDSSVAPPPSSRPSQTSNLAVSARLVAEGKLELEGQPHTNAPHAQTQHSGPPPYSLAFSSGSTHALANHSLAHHGLLHPYTPFGAGPAYSVPLDCADAAHPSKRRRTHYHLDVGAYGIPKHAPHAHVAGRGGHPHRMPGADAAVQVGEDAYFIRENAMGIADGVGGWNKSRRPVCAGTPSPSALFAQRLMHFCSEEVSAAHHSSPSDLEAEYLQEQLDDSLDDLADGLDVLMILERAYDKTIHAHVIPSEESPVVTTEGAKPPTVDSATPPTNGFSAYPPPSTSVPTPSAPVPLLEGSATALVAILEHPIVRDPKPTKSTPLFHPQVATPKPVPSPSVERGAVIRIAHLGDSMAMLVRGEEIIWRTEEMWWTFNTPVQLGPSSPTRPRDAQAFTIPVQEDDILILASDGLSDNLWDEDILDEVVRFRHAFLSDASTRVNSDVLRRNTLAGMLSEALCSRARNVAERKGSRSHRVRGTPPVPSDEIPFARRAREQGKWFDGGKPDDISVLVAVVSA